MSTGIKVNTHIISLLFLNNFGFRRRPWWNYFFGDAPGMADSAKGRHSDFKGADFWQFNNNIKSG